MLFPLVTDLPSPEPFRRLGGPLAWLVVLAVFDFRPPDDKGLGGWLGTLLSPRGGWGNELMLTDLRSVLPALFAVADAERGCGNDEVGAGVVGGGNSVLEGARSPVLGAFVKDLAGVDGGCRPDDFRVFATGSAGRAIVGGPFEGRLGLGSAVVILKPSKAYL